MSTWLYKIFLAPRGFITHFRGVCIPGIVECSVARPLARLPSYFLEIDTFNANHLMDSEETFLRERHPPRQFT